MKRLIIILLLFGILTVPIASAQAVSGWGVDIDRPFYFVGDNMTVTVTGIVGMNYSVDLVNTTTWMPIHLTTRGIGPSGVDRFYVVLDDEWIVGGRYYLNISIDGFHMTHRLIRIEYSEDYLHQKEHDWVRDSIAWMERAFGTVYDDMGEIIKDVALVMRTNFVLFVAVLIIGGQVFLHVLIPVLYAWAQKQQYRGVYKMFRQGCTSNQLQWHDLHLPAIHADHVPNVRTLADNALAAGLSPEMGKTIIWEATGSPGDGDFVRGMMNKLKWKRIQVKTLRALRLERGVAGAAYIEQANKMYKDFEHNIEALGKLYMRGVKKP